jgi:tetratricopeptide (TPR) repeat protein
MKADPFLNKAALLAKKRRYEEALKTLKDEEERYYGSFKYYYLYAVICLYAGNFAEAHEFFNLARKIKINDTNTMLGHALLYLRRLNTVQAVEYYLNIQEKDPKNKIVKRALLVIRKYSASEALSDWVTFDRLKKLFPPIPSPSMGFKTIIKPVLVSLAGLILVYGIFAMANILPNPFRQREQRITTDFILSSQDRSAPVQIEGLHRYILTRDQAINLYENALALFASYRDEAAKINLNRIMESNASEGIKNRARTLLENMEVPGFNNFNRSDNPAFSQVIIEPVIYRNVHVIWRGMATNVEITDEFTRFDFLVGYDTRRTLEGIVPVVFYSPVAINIERPLEVLGRIELNFASSHSEFGLEGVAIHQSGRLEN